MEKEREMMRENRKKKLIDIYYKLENDDKINHGLSKRIN